MKLINGDKEFDVLLKKVTGATAKIIYEGFENMPKPVDAQKYALLLTKYLPDNIPEGVNEQILTMNALKEAFKNGDITKEDLESLSRQESFEDKLKRNNIYLSILQQLIDTKLLTNANANLVASDIEGDFWQNQNLTEVKIEVNRFRQTAEL